MVLAACGLRISRKLKFWKLRTEVDSTIHELHLVGNIKTRIKEKHYCDIYYTSPLTAAFQ